MSVLPTIGFSNISDEMSFTAAVRASIEHAASQEPDIELLVRTNDFSTQAATQHAEEFAALPVDLAALNIAEERDSASIHNMLLRKGVPVVAIEIPIPLAIFLGIDNRAVGRLQGAALGEWVAAQWGGTLDKVLVLTDHRHITHIRTRLDTAVDTLLQEIPYHKNDVFFLDCSTTRTVAAERVHQVLQNWDTAHRIGVLCDNDDTAMGALDAARALSREESLAIVGSNATLSREEFKNNPQTRLIATIDFHAEQYGPLLIDLARRLWAGEQVPRSTLIAPTCITAWG